MRSSGVRYTEAVRGMANRFRVWRSYHRLSNSLRRRPTAAEVAADTNLSVSCAKEWMRSLASVDPYRSAFIRRRGAIHQLSVYDSDGVPLDIDYVVAALAE